MKQLYVITMSSGSYEDHWSKAEFITDDEDKATEFCDRKNAEIQDLIDARDQLRAFQSQWLAENPAPPWFLTKDSTLANPNPEYPVWSRQRFAASEQWYEATYSKEMRDRIDHGDIDTQWEYDSIGWLE